MYLTRMRSLLPLAAALVFVSAAGAVGPSLPAEDGVSVGTTAVSFVTHVGSDRTTELTMREHGRAVRTVELPGSWGVPLVAYGARPGGLSPNGRVLVLSDAVDVTGRLRAHSRFAVVDTRTLAITRTISLRGDYSFDALSPQARTLFLIHHVSNADPTRYQVQAYDLKLGRLLPRVIADREQEGWIMNGYPVARTTETGGRWVYTLYEQSDNYPFVHALDTVGRTAVCIGVPSGTNWDESWIGSAKLRLSGGKLLIEQPNGKLRYTLDTQTFRISAV